MTNSTTITYRAAYINGCVLTGPSHADLSDEVLLAIAIKAATEQGAIGSLEHQASEDDIEIGEWAEA